jgi:hypothetical protein
MRFSVSMHPPYARGGIDLRYGVNCSGLIYAAAPDIIKRRVKRSTARRMELGREGWTGVKVPWLRAQEMDLGFTDGHTLAVVDGRTGLLEIIHSTSSRGPVEEPMPPWVQRQNPRFKRLTIGD